MGKFWRATTSNWDLKFYAIFLVGSWTLVVMLSLVWQIKQEEQTKTYLAREIARSHLEKDLLLREWNINHGFVYAPITPGYQPNPHLQMPDREVVTPSGKTLTAINSSWLIRQLHELSEKRLASSGRLTSLKPLRPENAPDPWEQQALQQLAGGAPEVSDVVKKNGQVFFRLMQPLKAQENCFGCHQQPEYVPGQVAGGMSVTLPMASVLGAWNRTKMAVFMAHGFLWLVGLLGLVAGARQLHAKIQAKEKVQKALRQSESRYRLLVKNIPALVYRGYADGRVDFVDDKVEKLTGYALEDFAAGRITWPQLILPEDQPGCKRIFLQALKGDGAYRREYRLRKRDGEIIWVVERSQIVCHSNGRVDFISGVILDISLQKEMEQSLKESERFWKTILEAVGVGLMVIDRHNGRITEVNPRAAAMLGRPRDQIIGQNHRLFFQCPSGQETDSGATGAPDQRSEGKVVQADGTLLPIWKTAAPITIEAMTYTLVSFVDLTDQRQAEMALTQANADLQAAFAKVEQANKEIGLIGKMVELLQVCQNPEEALPIIGQYTQELFPGLGGALYILNASNNLLTAACHWGPDFSGEQIFNPADCWGLRQGRAYFTGLAALAAINPRCHHLAPKGQTSSLCLPLLAQGETMGLLVLAKGRPAAGTGETDLSTGQQKLARTLAEHISLSLANLRLRESLRHQAIRDSLTGLFNRRYLQETMEREIYRAQRRETTVGVIMLDVDHFKIFNDTYGHEAGDRVLAVLGRYLHDAVRTEDIACRYGGEEFTLILPEISPEDLLKRAEIIREGAKNLEFLYQGKLLGGVTISLGLSYYPQHGDHSESLLQAADAALYQAKRTGRDRVVMAGCRLAEPMAGTEAA